MICPTTWFDLMMTSSISLPHVELQMSLQVAVLGEGLLAVGLRAVEGFLARVDSHVVVKLVQVSEHGLADECFLTFVFAFYELVEGLFALAVHHLVENECLAARDLTLEAKKPRFNQMAVQNRHFFVSLNTVRQHKLIGEQVNCSGSGQLAQDSFV